MTPTPVTEETPTPRAILFGLPDSAHAFMVKHFGINGKNGLNIEVSTKYSYKVIDGSTHELFIYKKKGFRTLEEILQKKMEEGTTGFYFCALRHEGAKMLIPESLWSDELIIDTVNKTLEAARKQEATQQTQNEQGESV